MRTESGPNQVWGEVFGRGWRRRVGPAEMALYGRLIFIQCRYGEELRSIRLSSPSPVLDKNRALTGPEILSSIGAGVWRKALKAFPDRTG